MSESPEVDPYRPPQAADLGPGSDAQSGPPQRLAGQLVAVCVVAVLAVLLFRLGAIPVVLLAGFTFADAWVAGIHKKPDSKGFLNISAAGWSVAVLLFAVVGYPVYAFSRNRLKTRPGNTALFVLVNVFGVLLLALFAFSIVGLLLRPILNP